jgi:hypothetical protein
MAIVQDREGLRVALPGTSDQFCIRRRRQLGRTAVTHRSSSP